MKSFEPGFLERQKLPSALLRAARELGEYRARRELFERPSSRLLDQLRERALTASLVTSNRLDGLNLAPERLHDLVARRGAAENRAEQEMAGYCEALVRVGKSDASGAFTPGTVLQLHEAMFRYVPEGGGSWKLSDDLVTETMPDGSTAVVFTPVPAYGVEDAMNRLHEGLAERWRAGTIDPLLLIPAYLLDFLCIHPFSEGNRRMLRLLARQLLARAGYGAAAFAALDLPFERSKAECSAAWQASWRGWDESKHNLGPWTEWFLGAVLDTYRQLEHEIDIVSPPRGAQRDRVEDAIARLPNMFRYTDLERLVPSVSRPTINRVLRRLRSQRTVRCVKRGRTARWERT